VLLDEQSDVLRGGGRRAERMEREVAQRIAASAVSAGRMNG
jgi:hypothetical protein